MRHVKESKVIVGVPEERATLGFNFSPSNSLPATWLTLSLEEQAKLTHARKPGRIPCKRLTLKGNGWILCEIPAVRLMVRQNTPREGLY